jgi:hypothetical protein
MIKNRNFLPTNHGKFDLFFWNIIQYMDEKSAEWKHIPKEAQDGIIAEYSVWNYAYDLTLKPHTPLETLGKQNAYKKTAKYLRGFINQYLRHPPVTDLDRLAMGIPSPGPIHASNDPPAEEVDFLFKLIKIRKLEVHFRVEGASNKAKPMGYIGAIIAYDILDISPSLHTELTRQITVTRTPYTLEFDEADRGKTVYVAMRWQNRKGQNGAWTVIRTAVIP